MRPTCIDCVEWNKSIGVCRVWLMATAPDASCELLQTEKDIAYCAALREVGVLKSENDALRKTMLRLAGLLEAEAVKGVK